MLHDIRYGLRMLLKKPGFTLIAVLSLALGIGANTAIFSLVDAVMIKSLPVQQPEQLVLFGKGEEQGAKLGFPDGSSELFSYRFYSQTKQRTDVFSGVAGLLSMTWNVHGFVNANGPSDIQQMEVQLVSGNYFNVLGVNAGMGRVLTEADDQTVGGHPVTVISHEFWEERFGGDPAAVGKTIKIDETTYTVIGVAPKEFFGTTVGSAPDIWVPLAMEKQIPPAHWNARENERFQSLHLIGRLKDGVTIEQASGVVNLLFKQFLQALAGAQPTADRLEDIQKASIEMTPAGRGLSQLREQFSLSLKVLMGVVALVLLIASANVANLLLAHGTARQREFALRLAVGAGRLRLVRQLFTESALLVLLGAIAGVAFAWWGSRLLLLMASDGPEALPLHVTPNIRVLAFTIGVSALCAIVFGTAPSLRASRVEPNTALKGGKTVNALRNPLGKAFVVAQVALSLLLLVGAGLFTRTLIKLQSIPSGFNQENALLLRVDTSATSYKDDDPRLPAMLRDVEDKVREIPGVQAASFAFFTFHQGLWSGPAHTREPNSLTDDTREIRNNVVGPDYFSAMGIPLVQGRGFGPQDTDKSQKVAVITELMAKRFFPNSSPLGKRFGIDGPESSEKIEVVGVVKDAKVLVLTEAFQPMAYYPHSQSPGTLGNFVVRFSGSAGSVVPQVRQAIKTVNPSLPIDDVVSLSDHIGRSLVQQKLIARLASFFGLLALLLACVGLYGVMSYGVARRTNEIGIRMALGARGGSVLWLVLREALTLVVIGLVIGVVASLAVTKTAESLLYELKPNDPLTITLATLLLAGVALVAGYLPARRAARVNPMVALRDE